MQELRLLGAAQTYQMFSYFTSGTVWNLSPLAVNFFDEKYGDVLACRHCRSLHNGSNSNESRVDETNSTKSGSIDRTRVSYPSFDQFMLLRKNTTPIFILGCQRSGTTMFQSMFARSRHVEEFDEGNRRAMTEGWRLRDDSVITDLIRRSRKKIVLFKPLNDSQFADRYLDNFPGSRIIWMFRNPFDTVNSAVTKWGAGQLDMMTWIAASIREAGSRQEAMRVLEARPGYAIYAERMADNVCDKLLEWTERPLSEHAGAAILWYLRNRIFFDLDLSSKDRAMLMSYEDLVQGKEIQIRRICEFIGIRYSNKYAADVRTSSVGKSPKPPLPDAIEEAVVSLQGQLESRFLEQS